MKILIITNYYPPSNYGWGYMQLCEEVTDGLAARGHEVTVLTSTRCDGPEVNRPYPVHRLLNIDPDWHNGKSAAWQFFVGRKQREAEDIAHLRKIAAEFQPDLLFIWHAIGLSRAMLQTAESMLQPTVYYFAGYLPELPDEYVAFWQKEPVHWTAKLLKQPLAKIALNILQQEGKPIRLKYEHAICVSDYVRQRLLNQGLIPDSAVVIHNGIDTRQFKPSERVRDFTKSLKFLCAGRLEYDKGVHIILEALGQLDETQQRQISHLAIVGDGESAYKDYLYDLVQQNNLASIVKFLPAVSREEIPSLLDNYDALIQPSALEALSRMVQEAMAMGLLVVGTVTGGSGELLRHGVTGLAFNVGDAKSLAEQLKHILARPDMTVRLAHTGQETVRSEFTIELTTTKIENYLQDIVTHELPVYE